MEGEEKQSTADVKEGVEGGDVAHVHGRRPEGQAACRSHGQLSAVDGGQEDQRTDDIKIEVEHGRPPGVAAGADGGDKGGNTGADVLSHDDGEGDVEGDDAGGGEGLQDAHRGGGALEQGGDQGAHHDAQQGIGEGHKEVAELRHILEGGHRSGHGVHADEQQAQAQQQLAHNPLLAALDKHVEHNAHNSNAGAKVLRAHHGEKQVVRGDVSQTENLGGDSGADVGAHDDAHGLLQLHDARVDEAHAHDGGGGRAVDQTGDQGADEYAHKQVVGQPFQNGLQTAAG